MISAVFWYLSISVIGWLAFPLAYRLLPALPERGYALARTVGLLVWAYTFWLLGSLGVLGNNLGGLLLALVILLALSGWALRPVAAELLDWLRAQRGYILCVELLFLAAFAGMVVVRAANPEILGTEKPMELSFINAILNSPTLPPHDPWLSGYAISYYYFGYVMVGMMALLNGTPGGIAFNLGLTLVFSLSAVGAYGVLYNLLQARSARLARRGARDVLSALAGPLFVLLIGNLAGFLEVLHSSGLFWRQDSAGQLTSSFWKWLDLVELSQPPAQPFSLVLDRYLWWWRASRVVQDYDFAGNYKEVIDEFPAFSYILGDLHPHVLAMPFAFLAMAVALNLLLGGAQGRLSWLRRKVSYRALGWMAALLGAGGIAALWLGATSLSVRTIVLGLVSLVLGVSAYFSLPESARLHGFRLLSGSATGELTFGPRLQLNASAFLFAALAMGGLGFLNTWDFPFYVVLVAGAYAVHRYHAVGFSWKGLLAEFLGLAAALVAGGIVLYLPFYLGFSSQAGGILPNVVYPTRGAQMWVMFAPLFLPIFGLLLYLWRSWKARLSLGFAIAGGLMLALFVVMLLFTAGITLIPVLGDLLLDSLAAPNLGSLISMGLARRLSNSGGWLTLLALLGLSLSALLAIKPGEQDRGEEGGKIDPQWSASPTHIFTVLLIILGGLLILAPEFFYLRDLFGWRINTTFKFYYQAWLLWAVAAAYAALVLVRELRAGWNGLFSVLLALTLGMALTYTVFGLNTKTNGFNPPEGWTLEGTAYMERQNPDEMAAARWLNAAPAGVVAEAVGGSYTVYARISMLSGQPTVLGWDFHEMQWRGSGREQGSRQADIQRLYCTRDPGEAQEIMKQYNIRYVYIGDLERITYAVERCPGGLNEAKFQRFLKPVFQQGSVVIYSGG